MIADAPGTNAIASETTNVNEEKEATKVDLVKSEPTVAVTASTNGDAVSIECLCDPSFYERF